MALKRLTKKPPWLSKKLCKAAPHRKMAAAAFSCVTMERGGISKECFRHRPIPGSATLAHSFPYTHAICH